MITPPASGSSSLPWYRQGWPWLLILGPAVVVVAGVITFWLAASTDDTVVNDDYYKRGKEIHLDHKRDVLALKQGLSAQVMVSEDNAAVRVLLKGGEAFVFPDQLHLSLAHPTLADRDIHAVLQHQGGGIYQARLQLASAAHWYVQLQDPKQGWRLHNEWKLDEGHAFSMAPPNDIPVTEGSAAQ
ncbi:FixH family protein [Aquaspirillum serpens]|uniref:FixH family protein n=1 Tax=Aquaspirillum serpens TaxID=190 RepID=UPI0003B3A645|nr:FixH family protein [Aquaspirillum serpens]